MICFRCHRVALIGDIQTGFLMLLIPESDGDVLRFLWVDDANRRSLTFVDQFSECIYVDDLNTGAEDEDDAFLVYHKSKLRLLEGGFNLRKFCSNSRILMDRINENEAHLTANQIVNLVTEEMNQSQPESKPEFTMKRDESYTKGTTGNMLDPVKKCEKKILGVKWNY